MYTIYCLVSDLHFYFIFHLYVCTVTVILMSIAELELISLYVHTHHK